MDCGIDGLTFRLPSLVKPEFADECDIKLIVKRFLRTGQMPDFRPPSDIVDATQLPDNFQDLQDRVAKTTQAFEMLPLEERNKFNNDPLAWLAAQDASKEEPKDPPKEEPKDPPKEEPKDPPN